MNTGKNVYVTILCVLGISLVCFDLVPAASGFAAQSETVEKPVAGGVKDSSAATQQPYNTSRAAREEKALQDARRQQLTEKEAVLAAKEQELKKLSDKLEAQLKALEENRKKLDESLAVKSAAQKKQQDEKIAKMVKLFKTMRSEQAGKMIDSLKEDVALSLLSKMDTKTVAKLAPFISQPRVVKWVTDNLQEH